MILTKSCLRNWYKYKISCCDTVEQILAQGKTSTIGIKSLSGNDKNQSYLVQVFPELIMILLAFPWLVPYTDNFPALNNLLYWLYWLYVQCRGPDLISMIMWVFTEQPLVMPGLIKMLMWRFTITHKISEQKLQNIRPFPFHNFYVKNLFVMEYLDHVHL